MAAKRGKRTPEPDDSESEDQADGPARGQELKALARDGGVALGAVALVFLLAFLYTDNWPPLVVVESGSMQHDGNPRYEEPGYAHIGTIDTGDLVLVKQTSEGDLVTYLEGKQTGYKRYGDYGDVIIYYKNGLREGCNLNASWDRATCANRGGEWGAATPVIHRAMCWVEVMDNGSYYIPEVNIWFTGGRIDLNEIGANGLTGLKTSGYLTRGDSTNNRHVDQQSHTDFANKQVQPVDIDWIEGKARGELPWFGLIKLRLTQPDNYDAAPTECKRMLLLGLAVVIIGPFTISHGWEWWKAQRRAAREADGGDSSSSGDGEPDGARGKSTRRGRDDSAGDAKDSASRQRNK